MRYDRRRSPRLLMLKCITKEGAESGLPPAPLLLLLFLRLHLHTYAHARTRAEESLCIGSKMSLRGARTHTQKLRAGDKKNK